MVSDEGPVRQVLAEVLASALDWHAPLPDGRLSEHFSSLQRVALVARVEDHLDIELAPEDTFTIDTIDDLVSAIARARLAR